jgi:hypothetical protein
MNPLLLSIKHRRHALPFPLIFVVVVHHEQRPYSPLPRISRRGENDPS